jgi:hypothetical protein
MKIFDQHALVGASGTGVSLMLQNVNMVLSMLIALVTLAYMIVKLTNEIKKAKANAIQRPDIDEE